MRRYYLLTAAWVLVLSVTGCSSSVNGNAGTTGCVADSTVSCYSGGVGYSCSGSSRPSTAGQVCSTNNVGDWCCYASTACNLDSNVTCASGSWGYSCTQGSAAPDTTDSSLLCSIPTTANGSDEYCCTSPTAASGTTCEVDQTVAGCVTGSYGFSCSGSDRPDTDYSGITCSDGTASASATLYCCSYNGTSTTTTITCNDTLYQDPAAGTAVCGSTCDACLQKYECKTQYTACDSACEGQVQSMETCMKNAADANGGSIPSDAESTCSTSYLGGTNSAAYALWWEVIRISLDCAVPCCAS